MANSGPAPSRAVPGIVPGAALAVPAVRGAPHDWWPVAFTARAVEALIAPLPAPVAGMAFGLGGVGRRRLIGGLFTGRRQFGRRSGSGRVYRDGRSGDVRRSAGLAACCRHGDACLADGARPSDRPGRHTSIISGSLGAVAAASLAGTELLLRSPELMAHPAPVRLAEPSATVSAAASGAAGGERLRPARPSRSATGEIETSTALGRRIVGRRRDRNFDCLRSRLAAAGMASAAGVASGSGSAVSMAASVAGVSLLPAAIVSVSRLPVRPAPPASAAAPGDSRASARSRRNLRRKRR